MTRNTVLMVVFLGLLAALGYLWYGYYSGAGEQASSGAATEFSTTLASVRRFKNLELDTSLFEDRFFLALESPLPLPQPEGAPGRPNPFTVFK